MFLMNMGSNSFIAKGEVIDVKYLCILYITIKQREQEMIRSPSLHVIYGMQCQKIFDALKEKMLSSSKGV